MNYVVSITGIHAANIAVVLETSGAEGRTSIHAELFGYGLKIAIISETHFKAHHQPSNIRIDGFQLFRHDRLARRSRGVAVLVAEKYHATELAVDVRTL